MKITENEFYIKSTYSKIDEGRKMSKNERKRENGLEVNFSDCITMKNKSFRMRGHISKLNQDTMLILFLFNSMTMGNWSLFHYRACDIHV